MRQKQINKNLAGVRVFFCPKQKEAQMPRGFIEVQSWTLRPESALDMINQPKTKDSKPVDYCDHLWREGVIDAVEAGQKLYFGFELDAGRIVKDVILCAECAEPMLKERAERMNRAFIGLVAKHLSIDEQLPVTREDIDKAYNQSGKDALTYQELRDGVRKAHHEKN